MTVDQMIDSFLIYFDKITNFSAPGYETSEKLLFLNNAQDEFIKERVFGMNFQPPKYDDNQKRVADIRPLVVNEEIDSGDWVATNAYINTEKFPLSTLNSPGLLYYLNMNIVITRTHPTIATKRIKCDYIQKQFLSNYEDSGLNKSHFINPKVWVEDDNLYIMIDSYTTVKGQGYMSYIKPPTALIVGGNCDLEDHTHQEIVDIAVRQAMQTIQDQRYQSQVVEKQIKSE